MRKMFLISMILLFFSIGYSSDSGITGLTEDTAPVSGDYLVTKDTSASQTKKVNILNCLNAQDHSNLVINGMSGATFVVTYNILQVGACSLESGNFTVDVDGGTGVLKLDTGTYATTTWYYIWVICKANGATPSAFISLSATAPTMPADYIYKRRIGSLRSVSTSAYRKFHTNKYGYFVYDSPVGILASGTQATYTDISCASVMPPTSTLFFGNFQVLDNAAGCQLQVHANGDAATGFETNLWHYSGGSTADQIYQNSIQSTDTAQVIEYKIEADDAEATILVCGYFDNL